MNTNVKMLLIFPLILFLCSCAHNRGSGEIYEYCDECIRLHMKGDEDLNYSKNEPHTLKLCVYQLKNQNAFNQLKGKREGLSKLLECNDFDPSVTHSKPYKIHPDQEVEVTLDRFEGSKYIGVVAGYFERFDEDQTVRMYKIPTGFFTKKPKKVDLELILGPFKIEEFREK